MGETRPKREQHLDLLREVRLFYDCTRDELRRIDSLMTMMEAPRGALLTEQDTPGSECFVIVEGSASAWRNGRRLSRLEPGSFFGELALLDRKNRTATVVAETAMRLLVLSRRDFMTLSSSIPIVTYRIMTELGARLRSTDTMLGTADDPGAADAEGQIPCNEERRLPASGLPPGPALLPPPRVTTVGA